MAQLPEAYVAHASAGRARLRVPAREGREAFFEHIARELVGHPAVREVRATARTASLLILYEGELAAVLEYVRELNCVRLAPYGVATSLRSIRESLDELDRRIVRETRGTLGLGTIMFTALSAAALFQAQHGQFLPAGMTLLRYALDAMERESGRPATGS